ALGALSGLALWSLLLTLPLLGKIIFGAAAFFYLILVILQTFTPESRRYAWQKKFPEIPRLGLGLLGFLSATLCWITAWYWLLTPSLGLLLPLALIGVLGLSALSFLLRFLLRKSGRNPALPRDIRKSGMDILLATAGGLLLAFSPLMWSQAVIAEVYTLNAFFLSALLLLILWYIHDPRDKLLRITAFLFALGLTNHQSLLFLIFFLVAGVGAGRNLSLLKDGLFLMGLGALGFCFLKAFQYHQLGDPDAQRFFLVLSLPVFVFLISLALTRSGLFRHWKLLGSLVALGILGLSFHLYMPLASEQNPPMNWANTRTLEGFRHSLTRGQYARFSVADNLKLIAGTVSQSPEPPSAEEPEPQNLYRSYVRRTLFLRMLGSYFFDPDWKYSIASQFSWQFPLGPDDPTGVQPPPPERQIPLALFGLIPLLCFSIFPRAQRGWFVCSLIAMFFLSVVFLTIQWPELNHNDLWVKRVQYVQAQVLFAVWMALGASVCILILYAFLPHRLTLTLPSVLVCALYIAFPLHKEFTDPKHLEQLGASNHRGHDFGWQYGFYQLKGANGILLDELAHHPDPEGLVDDWALNYLRTRGFPVEDHAEALESLRGKRIPRSRFRTAMPFIKTLSKPERRLLEQALTLAAFRSLPPETQAEQLRYLPSPLPDPDYPPEMDQNGILFGGTDPGRFVPTYMIFSAECRPDLFILT
ncbi:MAG: protein O-mannosyl-transferase family, partial [Kiritimatiellia bacterium]